jgi:hypothetical protein
LSLVADTTVQRRAKTKHKIAITAQQRFNLAQTAPQAIAPHALALAQIQHQLSEHAPASPSLQLQSAIALHAPALLLP